MHTYVVSREVVNNENIWTYSLEEFSFFYSIAFLQISPYPNCPLSPEDSFLLFSVALLSFYMKITVLHDAGSSGIFVFRDTFLFFGIINVP